jgi:hypothetical protein
MLTLCRGAAILLLRALSMSVIEQTVAPQAMDTIINWFTAVNVDQR